MTSLTSITSAALLGLSMLISPAAQAHDDAYLDTLKAPHGGQLRMAGAQHYELVLVKDGRADKASPIVVYVTDHAGTAISTKGASGNVILLSGTHKVSSALQADGDNRLKGSANYVSGADLKAVVSITLAGQAPQQARFTPLANSSADHAGHAH